MGRPCGIVPCPLPLRTVLEAHQQNSGLVQFYFQHFRNGTQCTVQKLVPGNITIADQRRGLLHAGRTDHSPACQPDNQGARHGCS